MRDMAKEAVFRPSGNYVGKARFWKASLPGAALKEMDNIWLSKKQGQRKHGKRLRAG
jgi:hypothetical protein